MSGYEAGRGRGQYQNAGRGSNYPNPNQNPNSGRGSYSNQNQIRNPNPGRGSYANPNPTQNPNPGRGSYASPKNLNPSPGRGSYPNPNPIQNPNPGRGSYPDPSGPGPQQTGYVYPNPRGPSPQQSGYVYPNPRGPSPQQSGYGYSNPYPNPRGPGPQEYRNWYSSPNPNLRGPSPQNPSRPLVPAQQASGSRTMGVTVTTDLPQASRQMEAIQKAPQVAATKDLEKKMDELAVQPVSSSKAVRFPSRPGKGTFGQRVLVKANHFLVQLPDKGLYHYDVVIMPKVTSRGVNRAIIRALINIYQSKLGGKLPVYDGMRSLYTAGPLPFKSQSFDITLTDQEQLKRERVFKVEIRHVGNADPRHLEMFLSGRQLDAPLEAIQVLDTVFRETPSNGEKIALVGRSFFCQKFGCNKLGDGLESWRGFYQSLRPTQMGLSLNLDTASTAFIESISVTEFVSSLLGKDIRSVDLRDSNTIKKSLKNVKVEVTHRGNMRRKYRISSLSQKATKDLTFPIDEAGTQKSVVDYFREEYNYHIKYIHLPCLQMSGNKITYLPMEVCKIVEGQRHKRKLNENQVTNMLRSTCQTPADREKYIVNTLRGNKYNKDSFVIEFGMSVDANLTEIEARILPAPKLKYHEMGAEKECLPRFGQWNMKDKKLVNGAKVNNWYCISFSNFTPNDAGIFCKKLGDMCRVSGMEFAPNPVIPPIQARANQLENVLKSQYRNAINALKGKLPDLLIVILPNSNGNLYSDLKRICETDIGLVTQCCLTKNVMKCNAQFLANLALKINVKVGGRNTVLVDAMSRRVPIISVKPTIIFGADVTHPNPGDDSSPSIAAVVASQDWPEAATYFGNYRAQAHRQEIISGLGEMVKEHLITFRQRTNFEPKQIIFYRDGVSEGQFHQVLAYEIDAIRKTCLSLSANYKPSITFIVVQKRHHTRLFPTDNRNMDRSGNVLPGTVVDTKICHPTEFDFYLCSHAGIQGTSRPTHYHVLWDDNNFSVDDLEILTYDLCYTYARCTRSVSVAPAAYYAHQIAYRARSYLEADESDSRSSVQVRPLPALKANVKNVMFYC